MSEWTLDLPYAAPPLSLNGRHHWTYITRTTSQLKQDTHRLALHAKLPRGLERVEVVLHWQPRTKRKRDTDNPTPTLKACIDGLTRLYKLVPDDDSDHVSSRCVIEPVAATARLWLTITDLGPS